MKEEPDVQLLSHLTGLFMITFKVNPPSGEIFDSEGILLGRLNSAEIKILLFLASKPAIILDKDALLDTGWPKKIVSPNSLNVAIKNIREVFERKCGYDDVIQTHVKKGFSWSLDYSLSVTDNPIEHETSTTQSENRVILEKKQEKESESESGIIKKSRLFLLCFISFLFIFMNYLLYGSQPVIKECIAEHSSPVCLDVVTNNNIYLKGTALNYGGRVYEKIIK